MARDFLVIGLGTFGSQAAIALYEGGATVMAIDRSEPVIEQIGSLVSRAVCADATNEEALDAVGAFDAEVAIVALRRHFDTGVLATHMLKRRGLREILVQVDSEKEAEAIQVVGATQIVFPERDMARNIARRLLVPDLADQIPLGGDVVIIEFRCPESFIGKSLIELNLRKNYGITVIAVRSPSPAGGGREQVQVPPSPDKPLQADETLLLMGQSALLARFKAKVAR